ncbi:AMP-binding protein, partial [Klebsiella pneumoniae]|uniref:AMP-binding protein n=1 Tax=Klebsiella pneumoniae TaxID=573 RepID=UPI003853B73E
FSTVPAILARLAELPREAIPRLPALRFVICGAAPANADLLALTEERLGVPVLEGYGLTEATCASTCNPLWGERKPGTVGRVLPGQQIVILGEDGIR